MPPLSSRGGQEAANQSSCFLSHNHHHMQDLRNQPAASVSRDPPWGRKALLPSGISKVLPFRMFSQQSSSCTHLKCTVVQPCPLESWSQQSRSPGLVLIRVRGSSSPGGSPRPFSLSSGVHWLGLLCGTCCLLASSAI